MGWGGGAVPAMTTVKFLPRISPVLMPSQGYSLFFHNAQTMVVIDEGLGHDVSVLGVMVGDRMKSGARWSVLILFLWFLLRGYIP